jgi:hypothetical protein
VVVWEFSLFRARSAKPKRSAGGRRKKSAIKAKAPNAIVKSANPRFFVSLPHHNRIPVPEPKSHSAGGKASVLSKVCAKYIRNIFHTFFHNRYMLIVANITKTKGERQRGRDRRGT